jgi:hypothetical protein
MTAWTIFVNPMPIPSQHQLWLLLPLCIAVAVTYKTIRTNNLRRLPLEILILVAYMAAGLTALGAGLWLVLDYWR